MKKKSFFVLVVLLGLIAVAGVWANGQKEGSGKASSNQAMSASSSSASAGSKSFTVALLLPEYTVSRWRKVDEPSFIKDVKADDPNVTVKTFNAGSSASTQQSQAESAITDGAKVLVVIPVDGVAAAQIVRNADQSNVKVVSYDRLIQNSDPAYYVSFNNVKVGELQGKYIADHTKKGGTIVMINGSPTDPNATMFKQGALNILQPLFDNGTFKLGYSTMTPNWNPSNALNEMQQALTKLNDKVDGVLAANDGTAGGDIKALTAVGLAGKVPVTGQDATNAGLSRIIEGIQSMTVYKNVRLEASAAAKLAVHLGTGAPLPSGFVNGKVNNGQADIPSVLATPIAVTKDNIASTVIKDGYTTWANICVGNAANQPLCKQHM